MEYRTLGRTGIRVSTIALGCEGFMHKTAEEVKADFDFAIENGINFVDIYSSNPDLRSHIGFALEDEKISSYKVTYVPHGKTTNTCVPATHKRP